MSEDTPTPQPILVIPLGPYISRKYRLSIPPARFQAVRFLGPLDAKPKYPAVFLWRTYDWTDLSRMFHCPVAQNTYRIQDRAFEAHLSREPPPADPNLRREIAISHSSQVSKRSQVQAIEQNGQTSLLDTRSRICDIRTLNTCENYIRPMTCGGQRKGDATKRPPLWARLHTLDRGKAARSLLR